MLTIWGRINSHNVKKVVWLADELGLPYQRHDIGGQFGFDDAYRAKNPNALIPTIDDGEVTLWESNAILRYLAARHGGERFWPANPALRAVGDKWMDWQFSYADAQRHAFINLVRKAPAERDQAAIEKSAQKTGKLMAIMDATLAELPWLSGQEFGIGDIPMAVYAHTWFSVEMARPDVSHVRDWYDRLLQRQAFAAIAAVPLT